MPEAERFTSHARARLSAVLQTATDLVTIEHVMKALKVDRQAAAKVLSRWQEQGWLKRVGRGIYAPIPLDASTTGQVLKDPWVLVPALFAPGYIGGWTAAEHWDLTEQLFRSIFVFTARPFRSKEQTVQGVTFTLKRIPEDALFGLKTIWRGQARVSVADKHRTIVDLLADPATGGGIRHVARCLQTYLRDAEADADTLIRYAEKLGNGAVFKRLGLPGFADTRTTNRSPIVPSAPDRGQREARSRAALSSSGQGLAPLDSQELGGGGRA